MDAKARLQLQVVRSTRANPPGAAATDPDRRRSYGAALQQFDELLVSASEAGYASRPLPLFYALSQAGRAIVAARGSTGVVTAHGLSEDRTATDPDVLRRRIKRNRGRDDALTALCEALGIPDPFGSPAVAVPPVELGAIWAALPYENTYIPEWRAEWRPAMQVHNDPGGRANAGTHGMKLTVVKDFPDLEQFDPVASGAYPTIPPHATFEQARKRRFGLETSRLRLGDVRWGPEEATPSVFDITSRPNHSWDRWLMPAPMGSDQVFVPLTAWWVLLFGLSVFARYQPGLWADALDLDSSDRAAPLQVLLDSAVEAVPLLVAEALVEQDPDRDDAD